MNTATHIARIRQHHLGVKDRIVELLRWDDLGYCQYQEHMGYVYLRTEFDPDTPMVKSLPYMREYWAWWNNHWVRRDELFIPHAENILDVTEGVHLLGVIRGLYVDMHDPRRIGFSPHRGVLEQSYAAMIDKLIKEALYETD